MNRLRAASYLLANFSTAKTPIKKISISGVSKGPESVKAVFESNKKTVEASNPLELLVYSLISCANATLRTVAFEKKVKVGTVNFSKAEALYDTRGFFGLDSNNKFSKVSIEMEVQSDASEAKMQEIFKLVEQRCPVYNMIHLSGVEIDTKLSVKSL